MEMKEEKAQHFLIDEDVIKSLVGIANLTDKDKVLEIGAGAGNITKHLKGDVTAFETELEFEDKLNELQKKNDRIKVIYGNALDCDWKGYNKIVSNIPFYLSEAVLIKAIKSDIDEVALIVGDTFKKKLETDTRIAFVAKKFYTLEVGMEIGKASFKPEPRTKSFIIHLKKKELNEKDKILLSIALSKGKIKNSLIHVFMKKGKTKKESKEIVGNIKIESVILDKPASKITGNLLKRIEEELDKISK